MFQTLRKSTLIAAVAAVPVAVAVATAAPFPRLAEPATPMSADDLSLTETYCDLRATVNETLRRDFAEVPTVAALTGAGMMMELWTSDRLGTWTMVHHGTDGISCIVTTGGDWAADVDAVLLLDRALAAILHQS
jgi:hypothetical protein